MQRKAEAAAAATPRAQESAALTTWPQLNQQIQHDTNLASMDCETAMSRLNRLAARCEAEDDPRSRLVQEYIRQLDGLKSTLKGML